MYFPWIGFLEQLRLADDFVLYDDVQFSKGSFTNRVQIKTAAGPRWLTVPLADVRLGQNIDQVQINSATDWRSRHLEFLGQAYKGTPFLIDMLDIVEEVLDKPVANLSELSYASILALADYFGITRDLRCHSSADMGIDGNSSQRVFDIVRELGGTVYITGHGARNYLDHQIFDLAGVDVQYMNYRCLPYPQRHGAFTPYVSALDLVANCGRAGKKYIDSTSIKWKEFLNGSK